MNPNSPVKSELGTYESCISGREPQLDGRGSRRPEPFAVVSVDEMRALEAAAVEAGTPERVLQERAGLAVADVVEEELASAQRSGRLGGRRIVVLVGAGNNGRDAVVAGRRLAARGCRVRSGTARARPSRGRRLRDVDAEGIATRSVRREDSDAGPRPPRSTAPTS